jgi:hypothetical protein
MNHIQSKKGLFYLLFLLSPLLSLIHSFRFRDNGVYKNILWLFAIFYGLTISFPKGEENIDGYRRFENFEMSASRTDYSFTQFQNEFSDEDSTSVDIFEPLLTYGVSRITSSGQIMFGIYGLLFGFFYSRNFSYVLDRVSQKNIFTVFWLVLTLAFLNPFWFIGGFRYWFATQIFLYGLLPYLFENKKKNLLWLGLAPLIHFSYLFALLLFLVYWLIGNKMTSYFFYFVVCFFVGKIGITFISSLLSLIPSIGIQQKRDVYTNDEYLEQVDTLKNISLNWYATFTSQYIYWFVFITLLVCFIRYRKLISEQFKPIFCFILFYMGSTFLVDSVPSMSRFLTLGNVLVLSFLILFVNQNSNVKGLKSYLYWTKWGLYIYLLVGIRLAFDTVSFLNLFTNPIVAPFFMESNFSMIDLFK